MSKERTCKHCLKIYTTGCSKDQCYGCYSMIKKYGTATPDHHTRKCENCQAEYTSKWWKQKHCSKKCYRKQHTINARIKYRIENNIDLDAPVKIKAPNGMGHKEPHGYIYITKKRHPNSQKKGRIYEHTFVMSEHIGRPIKKGESIHHKNGIRDDNRIENLELWSVAQPAGQRVKDKIAWAKSFLKEYGITNVDETNEFC